MARSQNSSAALYVSNSTPPALSAVSWSAFVETVRTSSPFANCGLLPYPKPEC
jgi:hypothetical protein